MIVKLLTLFIFYLTHLGYHGTRVSHIGWQHYCIVCLGQVSESVHVKFSDIEGRCSLT